MDSCLVFVLWWIDVSAKDYANLWRTSVGRQLASSCHLPRGWSLNDSSTVRQLIYREFIKIMYKNFTCTKFYREGEALPSDHTPKSNHATEVWTNGSCLYFTCWDNRILVSLIIYLIFPVLVQLMHRFNDLCREYHFSLKVYFFASDITDVIQAH